VSLESQGRLNNEINLGAQIIAAGRTLGLSDIDTIALKTQTARKAQRQRRAERGLREQNRTAAEQFLQEDERKFQQKAKATAYEQQLANQSATSVNIDDEAWAFGEDPDYDRNPGKKGPRRPQDDEQTYSRDEKVRYDTLAPEFLTDAEVDSSIEGRSRPNSGRLGVQDALNQLKMADSQYGYSAFGAEGEQMRNIALSLDDSLTGSQTRIKSEAAARKAAERDRRQTNLTARRRNNEKAAADANDIAQRFTVNGPGSTADDAIGRIREVRSLGGAMPFASHDPVGNFSVVTKDDPSKYDDAIPLMRDGKAIAYYGQDLVELGDANIPGSANALNSPAPTPGQSWVSQNMPTYGKPDGTTFGFPQVGINEELALFGDRVRGLKGLGLEGMGNPRSLAEVEKVLSTVVGRSQQQGLKFTRPVEGRPNGVIVDNPTIDDVLYKLGYAGSFDGMPGAERSRLANALFQSQAASVVDVNQGDKQAFAARGPRAVQGRGDISMDVGEMRPDGGLPLASVNNEKIRGKEVKGQLRKISESNILDSLKSSGELTTRTPSDREVLLPDAARAIAGAREARNDAQTPFIGALKGEGVGEVKFIRGKDRGASEADLVSRYGGSQGTKAAEVQRRYLEDVVASETDFRNRNQPGVRLSMDRQFSNEQRLRQQQVEGFRESIELQELARLQQAGKPGAMIPDSSTFNKDPNFFSRPNPRQPMGPGNMGVSPAESLQRANTSASANIEYSTPGTFSAQEVRPSAVQPSIAPDPWAEQSRRQTSYMSQPDGPSPSYMSRPERPNSLANYDMDNGGRAKKMLDEIGAEIGQRAKRQLFSSDAAPTRNRRIGYGVGSLAVLGNMLGIGRDDEEDRREQY
jgi:hypothetical protein